MTVTIRAEEPADYEAIREVNRLAFDGDAEARLVDMLRAEGYMRLSLVAESDGALVGHILFCALPIETERSVIEALALAPLAVTPTHQRQGIGSALIREGVRLAKAEGYPLIVVLGHPNYYPRFGFSARLAEAIASPYSGKAFMALALRPGVLDGIRGEAHYPPPFERLD